MGLRALRGSSRSTFEGKRLILRVCVLIPSAPMYFFGIWVWIKWKKLGCPLCSQELATEGSDMGRVVLLEYGRLTSSGWFLVLAERFWVCKGSASGRWFLIMLLDHIPGALGVHGSPPTNGTLVEYTGGLWTGMVTLRESGLKMFNSYWHIKILWKRAFKNASGAKLIRISLELWSAL